MTAVTVPSALTCGLFRCLTINSDSAPEESIEAASAASPATSTAPSLPPFAESPWTKLSRKPSAPFAPSNPCVTSTSRNDMHDSEPTSRVAYDSIITDTCIMSQLLFSAGTSADAL